MQLPRDLLSETYQVPDVILCQTNKEKICKLNVINLEGTFKFNSYSEISFDVPSVYCDIISGETKSTPYYNYVEGLRLIYLEGFGYFQLQDPEINGNGIQEYKHINAYSLEYALSQRYLENFVVNPAAEEDKRAINGIVTLYDQNDVGHSLIHLVLEKAYGWKVGHIDEELKTQQRSFSIDRQSIYDFIMNDMCDTFKCYVEFDTIKNTINIYSESEDEVERYKGDGETTIFKLQNDFLQSNIVTINGHKTTQYNYDPSTKELTFSSAPGQGDIIEISNEFKHKNDTDVIIAFENLSNEMKVNYSADDIKTVLTVKGADDLDIRDVNFGLPSIMNLDYYNTPEWMGEELYKEYQWYVDKQDKYMTGFYSKDISGDTEESFDVIPIIETFNAGNIQRLPVQSVQAQFNINGMVESYGINKSEYTKEVSGIIEELEVFGSNDTFHEPERNIETIIAQGDVATFTFDGSYTFTLPEEFNLNENSVVKINGKEISKSSYSQGLHTITITEESLLSTGSSIVITTCANKYVVESTITSKSEIIVTGNGTRKLSSSEYYQTQEGTKKYLTITASLNVEDEIKIYTPLGNIQKEFELSYPKKYKILSVKVDNESIDTYTINDKTLTITDASILLYGSTIVVEYIQNSFDLDNLKEKVISIKINNTEMNVSQYDLNPSDKKLTITDAALSVGDIIKVESIDTHFDLSGYKDKAIVSVSVNDGKCNYKFNNNILTIDSLTTGDKVVVELVNQNFIISQNGNQILSVKIDSKKIDSNDYALSGNTLTINELNMLYSGKQVLIELIADSFTVNQIKDRIVSVKIDGESIDNEAYEYDNNKLIIYPEKLEKLKLDSNVIVESIDISFDVANFNGNVDSVCILHHMADGTTKEINTKNYIYNNSNNKLIVDDGQLGKNDVVLFKTIKKIFHISNNQKSLIAVKIDDKLIVNTAEERKYKLVNGELTIYTALTVENKVSAEFFDNHFILANDIGSKKIQVEKKSSDSMHFKILTPNDDYKYNKNTKTLTVSAPLKNGDKILVKTINPENALQIAAVDENGNAYIEKDGSYVKVEPILMSYEPKKEDYVVKVRGYTELLKDLYKLIDERLTEENSVPNEYKITEIILNPNNFNEAGNYLPEPSVKNLGEVYKIINQDSDGNTVACKYYICKIKLEVTKDESTGKEKQNYVYVWNEEQLSLGAEGISSLKEKEAIYSSIQDVQIAAEWDKKPSGSEENNAYKENLNKLKGVRKALEEKENNVSNIQKEIDELSKEKDAISKDLDINKNFLPESLDRLSLFLREDEYSDDCFCVTEIDTDIDKIDTQKELLIAGQKELKKMSQPKLSFSTSMKNIYAMPEFAPILHQFALGNFIKIKMRSDFIKKARLLEVQLNFSDLSNFSCTFGDLLSAKDQGDIHADLLSQAVSAGKTVASGSSYWQKGYDVATAIESKIKQGLIDATTSIKSNSAGQDISWDNYGIHLRKVVDGVLDKHEGWITNNKFLYSDDNFETTKSVFGNYTIDGKTYWGILAGCVSAGLIEGSKIIGGEICIGEQKSETGETTYNFRVAPDGTVTMNKGDAAAKLSYFSFDGDNGLIIGENKDGEYFSRVSAQKIEFCRKARILTVSSEPTNQTSKQHPNYDYFLYEHKKDDKTYYDYYKNPDFISKTNPAYDARYTSDDQIDIEAEIKFGIPITYFANDTTYMKQAEIEGNLKVGTEETTPSISLGKFKLQIESNGSLSIVAIQ